MPEGRDKQTREASRRAFRLVNALLKGARPTVAQAREVTGVETARAREMLRELVDEVECAENAPGSPTRVHLRGVRHVAPSHEMAIGACFAASLAPLFDGSELETGMKQGLQYLIDASPAADKFKEIERKFVFLGRGGESALPRAAKQLERLAKAIIEQHVVTFTHRRFDPKARDGRETYEPLAMAIYNHQLYVVGRRPKDHAIRLLRFCRIKNMRVLSARFPYPTDLEFNPSQLFRHAFGVYLGQPDAPVESVEIRLTSRWVGYANDHRWHASQKIEAGETGVTVRLSVRLCPELETWILGFGEEAEVIGPASLRERIAERAGALARVYR